MQESARELLVQFFTPFVSCNPDLNPQPSAPKADVCQAELSRRGQGHWPVGSAVNISGDFINHTYDSHFDLFCLFVLLLYVPSQQLWSWRNGQFT